MASIADYQLRNQLMKESQTVQVALQSPSAQRYTTLAGNRLRQEAARSSGTVGDLEFSGVSRLDYLLGNIPGLNQAGLPIAGALAAVPAALGALGISVPAAVGTALGVAGAGYAAYQALGGGEGGGIFGNNLLGGDEFVMGGIPFGGPGLPEPPASMLLKEWHVNYEGLGFQLQFYLVQMPNGRRKIAMYHTGKKTWKVWNWSTPRLAVIGKNMPSHKNIVRLRKNLAKHRADADTILRLTSPKYAAHKARRRHGHR